MEPEDTLSRASQRMAEGSARVKRQEELVASLYRVGAFEQARVAENVLESLEDELQLLEDNLLVAYADGATRPSAEGRRRASTDEGAAAGGALSRQSGGALTRQSG